MTLHPVIHAQNKRNWELWQISKDSPHSTDNDSVFIQRFLTVLSENTRRWANTGLMLGHGLRRWPNMKPTLDSVIIRHVIRQANRRPCLTYKLQVDAFYR